jgi:hypothetical protein
MMYISLPGKISTRNVNGVECTYDAYGKHSAVTPENIQTMDIAARYSVTAWAGTLVANIQMQEQVPVRKCQIPRKKNMCIIGKGGRKHRRKHF